VRVGPVPGGTGTRGERGGLAKLERRDGTVMNGRDAASGRTPRLYEHLEAEALRLVLVFT